MPHFIGSARKYRPLSFQALKGQEHVTTTLSNALKNNSLAQAFLFCGPKGTGKTSCARILGKAINCKESIKSGDPCHQCEKCQDFQQGRSLYLYELDAASHNSVEHVRSLIEQIRYHSGSGKKIFIIDEAHMLSNAAFNAFLKTLEEPPKHVTFILATTEKHKILPTILSRCQVFDFHAHTPALILDHLEEVAAKEKVAVEREALEVIAQQAEGSLRDALSAFDLVVTFQAGTILTYKATMRHLHLLDHAFFFQLTQELLQGNVAAAWASFHESSRKGFDGLHFLIGLKRHVRNLLMAGQSKQLPLIQVPAHLIASYRQPKQLLPSVQLATWWKKIYDCLQNYRQSTTPKMDIELLLLRLSTSMHKKTASDVVPLAIPAIQSTAAKAPAVTASNKQNKQQTANDKSSWQEKRKTLSLHLHKLQATSLSTSTLLPLSTTSLSFPTIEEVTEVLHNYRDRLRDSKPNYYYLLRHSTIKIVPPLLTIEVSNDFHQKIAQTLHGAIVSQLKASFPSITWKWKALLVPQNTSGSSDKIQDRSLITEQERWIALEKNQLSFKEAITTLGLILQ